jgi:phospholipid/cholesterol/gamma-HCH transport system ATP-binding protein
LDVEHDAITTIAGPSASGKSVLIKHLLGLLEPDAGEVHLLGRNLRSLTRDERSQLRAQVGVLFQGGGLFGAHSLADNLAVPLRLHTGKADRDIRETVMRALAGVGLGEVWDLRPGEVSAGMRTRAGLARAIILDPPIVVLDEPDVGLDPAQVEVMTDLILDTHHQFGGTYLIATSNVCVARKVSDYVGLMWNGRIAHVAEAEDVFRSPEPLVRALLARAPSEPLGME